MVLPNNPPPLDHNGGPAAKKRKIEPNKATTDTVLPTSEVDFAAVAEDQKPREGFGGAIPCHFVSGSTTEGS